MSRPDGKQERPIPPCAVRDCLSDRCPLRSLLAHFGGKCLRHLRICVRSVTFIDALLLPPSSLSSGIYTFFFFFRGSGSSMACALTRRFSNSSFIRSIRSLYLSNLLFAGLPFFLTFTVRVSLSQFIFHLYSCLSLSLSLSLSLLGDFSLVFLSGLTQFFFFFRQQSSTMEV